MFKAVSIRVRSALWRVATLPAGLGRSQRHGYWGNWRWQCFSSEIWWAQQTSQQAQGFHFIQCALTGQLQKKFFFHTKNEEEVVAQSCSGSVQIFLSSSLTWLFSSPSLPSLFYLLSCCGSACANVFPLCFMVHPSALTAARSLFPAVCPCPAICLWACLCSDAHSLYS